jgi:hypothetical protein
LHYACEHGNTSAIAILLQNSANINLVDDEKLSPLALALRNRHTSSAQLFFTNISGTLGGTVNLRHAQLGAVPEIVTKYANQIKTLDLQHNNINLLPFRLSLCETVKLAKNPLGLMPLVCCTHCTRCACVHACVQRRSSHFDNIVMYCYVLFVCLFVCLFLGLFLGLFSHSCIGCIGGFRV